MKKSALLGTLCACIYTILFSIQVSAANNPIDSMNITGGTLSWSLPGGIPEVIPFTIIGANTNLVGGYIGVGGSESDPFDPPNPDNLLIFPVLGGPISTNFGQTYTAASNLGATSTPAGTIPGGPVPSGTLDDTFNSIEMDLSSWFGNLNNATDIWAGTGVDDGFTSPVATGTWNPVTFEYVMSWNSKTPDEPGPSNPFPNLMSMWTLTGFAYPVTTVSITIDIKPDDQPNSINPMSKGVIPAAVLTTDDFDALLVDPDTVRYGPAEAERIHMQAHVEDVDHDGDMDLVFHFKTQETGIACGDTEATLTGETWDGTPISGTDSVNTVGCQ